jgi:hypothetical protein
MYLTEDQIQDIVYRFRQQLEDYCQSTHYPTLERFPHGACGDAVLLLGTYLYELGEEHFENVLGQRDDPEPGKESCSHAWLERKGLIIDITADQFAEIDEAVIISNDSVWHRGWRIESRQPSNLEAYEHRGPDQLRPVYGVLKKKMDT